MLERGKFKSCGRTVSLVHAPDRLIRKASGALGSSSSCYAAPRTPGNRSSARQTTEAETASLWQAYSRGT